MNVQIIAASSFNIISLWENFLFLNKSSKSKKTKNVKASVPIRNPKKCPIEDPVIFLLIH